MKRVTCSRSAVLLALVAALASACAPAVGSAQQGAPQQRTGPVRVGLLVPPSDGGSTTSATAAEEGARLALDLVNERHAEVPLPLASTSGLPGLDGAQVSLSVGTTTTDGRQTDQQIASLAENEHAVAVVAFGSTPGLVLASQRAEPHEIPFLGVGSSQGLLTERGLEWFFRVGPTDADYADAFLNVLSRQPDAPVRTRIAVVYPADQDGAATAYDVAATATQQGHNAVRVPVPPEQSTQTSAVAAALQSETGGDVDGIVLVAGDEDAARAETDAAAGVSGTFLGAGEADLVTESTDIPVLGLGAGFERRNDLRDLATRHPGLLTASAWSFESSHQGRVADGVRSLYAEQFGRPMTREAAETFTATYALLRAVDRTGSTDPATVRAALLALRLSGRELAVPWDGVGFDATHQNVGARGVLDQLMGADRVMVEPADLTGPAAPQSPRSGDPLPGSG